MRRLREFLHLIHSICMIQCSAFIVRKGSFRNDHLSMSIDEEAQYLLNKAKQLREEVEKIESSKKANRESILKYKEAEAKAEEERRSRYSAEIPILKADGSVVMEKCEFPPRIKAIENKKAPSSRIITIQAYLPLGIVLGQDETLPGITTVDEISENSNGMQAGIQVGDILRACTACQVSMDMPTWQLMAGGIGRPKTNRMMFSLDGKGLKEVMEALSSNNMDPQSRPTWLVLERSDMD